MRYPFIFNFYSSIAYPLKFFCINEGVYPLSFWGYSVIEIIRFTRKYAEFDDNKQKTIIKNVLKSSVESVNEVAKFEIDLLEDTVISAEKVVDIVVESLIEANSIEFKAIDSATIQAICIEANKFIDALINHSKLNKLWRAVNIVTEISPKSSGNHQKFIEIDNKVDITRPISIRGIEIISEREIFANKNYKTVEFDLDIDKHVSKSVNTVINKAMQGFVRKYVNAVSLLRNVFFKLSELVINITKSKNKNVSAIETEHISFHELKNVSEVNIDQISSPHRSSRSIEFVIEAQKQDKKKVNPVIPGDRKLKRDIEPIIETKIQDKKKVNPVIPGDRKLKRDIEPIIETNRNKHSIVEGVNIQSILKVFRKELSNLNLEEPIKSRVKSTEKNKVFETVQATPSGKGFSELILEIIHNKIKTKSEVGGLDVMTHELKDIGNPLITGGQPLNYKGMENGGLDADIKHKSYINPVISSINKKLRQLIVPLVPVDTVDRQYSEPVVPVDTVDRQYSEPVVPVDTKKISMVNVLVETGSHVYRDVRFGKRWRFRTGKAFDRIWINPEVSPLTVMAEMRSDILEHFVAESHNSALDLIGQVTELGREEYTNIIKNLILRTQVMFQNIYYPDFAAQEMATLAVNLKNKLNELLDELNSEYVTSSELIYAIDNAIQYVKEDYRNNYIIPYTEKKALSVEAKISFKAMLDFILFVEQLMYVNRFFYAASRAVTALDDMIRILEEWVIEGKPQEENADQYEYLVRWYKWWAEGYKGKYINDMELNGLKVLEQVRDEMVRYFESRWGKRIVEYGADGMYIYSKDFSYIDRIRGKKHGYAHRLVDLNRMVDDYGIGEFMLPYIVEEDRKQEE